jgi:hypothetical protein
MAPLRRVEERGGWATETGALRRRPAKALAAASGQSVDFGWFAQGRVSGGGGRVVRGRVEVGIAAQGRGRRVIAEGIGLARAVEGNVKGEGLVGWYGGQREGLARERVLGVAEKSWG